MDFDEEILQEIQLLFETALQSEQNQDLSFSDDRSSVIKQLISELLVLQDRYWPTDGSDVQTQQESELPLSKKAKLLAAHQLGHDITTTARQTEARDETMSLEEFALYAVKNAVDEADLNTVKVQFKSLLGFSLAVLLSRISAPAPGGGEEILGDSITMSLEDKKNLLKNALEKCLSTDSIFTFTFRGIDYSENCEIKVSQALSLFCSKLELKKQLKNLFQKKLSTEEYIHGMVHADNMEAVAVPKDLLKCKACVISGESGSGKLCLPRSIYQASSPKPASHTTSLPMRILKPKRDGLTRYLQE
jgi:hypothetical protein